MPQIKPLHHVAAIFLQQRQLGIRFHPFGHHHHFQAVRHGDDGARDGGVFGVLRQAADKTLVDLQGAHVEALQVIHRRVTGAEVVDRHLHADRPQLLHGRHGGAGVVHQGAFGQFQLQQFRIEAAVVQRRQHDLAEVLVLELFGRQVHRHADGVAGAALPRPGLVAGGAQHPFADRHDQACVLGQRNELVGRDQTALGMAPAHQGFDGDDVAAAHVDLRLIQQIQLLVFQGAAQANFELDVAHDLHGQRRAVQPGVVLAAVLGVVHGGVGEFEQRIAVVAVFREQRDADAGGDEDLVAFDDEGAAHRFLDAVGDVERMVDPLQVRNQDGEFVAAQPCQIVRCVTGRAGMAGALFSARDQIGGPGGFAQALGHHLEQVVADVVAEGVVDAFEGVEVHEQHGELLVADFRAVQFAFQRFQKGLAVGDAGQAVAVGQAADLFLCAFAFADVAHQAQHLGRPGCHQARLEVMDRAEAGQLVVDRADMLAFEHGLHLFEQAVGDLARQHLGDVLADAGFAGEGVDGGEPVAAGALAALPVTARPLAAGPGGAGAVVARFVIEIETVAVEPEKGIGNGRQHGAVLGIGHAQADDGVAGAQHVQHAVAEDRPVDRLGDEVGRAHLVGVGDRLDVVAAGDHDDRHRRARLDAADLAAGREAVHVRHFDVQQDQVRRHALEVGDGLHAVLGFDAVQAHLAEHFQHQQAHHRIVVRHQDHATFVGGK